MNQTHPARPNEPLASPRCAILGEALVDVFPQGAVIGGAPFNVARNLAALGQPPLTITRLGRDPLAERILVEFARFGMTTAGVQRDDRRPTGVVNVRQGVTGHVFEIGNDQAWDALDAQSCVEAVRRCQPDVVYFGTLAQRSAASRTAIREALQATDALRFLDLNLRDQADDETLAHDSLGLAQVVKVNDEELAQILEWFIHPGRRAAGWRSDAHETAVVDLMAHFGLKRLIVTRGAHGHAAFNARGDCVAQGEAPAVHIEDTVGAGDAFAAVSLLGHLLDWPFDSTLQRASEFAAAVCTLRGAVTADLRFYQAPRARWQLDPRRTGTGDDDEAPG